MDNKVYSNNRMDISDIHKIVLGDNKAFIDENVLIIDESSVDNGIEARVISAFMVNEKEMCVIFTLRDVTGENRLIKRSSLMWCKLEGEDNKCHSSARYGIIELDDKTNTAINSINTYTEKGFDGTITLEMKDIQQYVLGSIESDVIENIDIYTQLEGHQAKIISPPKVFLPFKENSQTELFHYGASYKHEMDYEEIKKMDILMNDEISIPFENIDWAKISNIGFVDGVLHIQVKVFLDRKSRGFDTITLQVGDTKYLRDIEIDFYEQSNFNSESIQGYVYGEYIYNDITDVSQLKDSVFMISYMDGGEDKEDINVSYTFKFAKPDTLTSITIAKNVDVIISETKVTADEIAISPLGLSIIGRSNESKGYKGKIVENVYILYKNGHKENLISGPGGSSTDDDINYSVRSTYILADRSPILMDGIDKVVINGSVFEVKYNL